MGVRASVVAGRLVVLVLTIAVAVVSIVASRAHVTILRDTTAAYVRARVCSCESDTVSSSLQAHVCTEELLLLNSVCVFVCCC